MLGNILDKCGVTILISVVSFVVGITYGLLEREDSSGVYMSFSYPAGGELFKLGNPSIRMEDIDFGNLGQTAKLLSKLENHPPDSKFSGRLRKLALDGDGPFKHINVTVNIHLLDNADFPGTVAKACKNSPLFKNPIVVYEVVAQGDTPPSIIPIERLLGFSVTSEHVSDCDLREDEIPEIWANRDQVKSWIKAEDFKDSSLMVKARMIISSL